MNKKDWLIAIVRTILATIAVNAIAPDRSLLARTIATMMLGSLPSIK